MTENDRNTWRRNIQGAKDRSCSTARLFSSQYLKSGVWEPRYFILNNAADVLCTSPVTPGEVNKTLIPSLQTGLARDRWGLLADSGVTEVRAGTALTDHYSRAALHGWLNGSHSLSRQMFKLLQGGEYPHGYIIFSLSVSFKTGYSQWLMNFSIFEFGIGIWKAQGAWVCFFARSVEYTINGLSLLKPSP